MVWGCCPRCRCPLSHPVQRSTAFPLNARNVELAASLTTSTFSEGCVVTTRLSPSGTSPTTGSMLEPCCGHSQTSWREWSRGYILALQTLMCSDVWEGHSTICYSSGKSRGDEALCISYGEIASPCTAVNAANCRPAAALGNGELYQSLKDGILQVLPPLSAQGVIGWLRQGTTPSQWSAGL